MAIVCTPAASFARAPWQRRGAVPGPAPKGTTAVVLAPGFAALATWGDSLYVPDHRGAKIRQIASAMLPDRTCNLALAHHAKGRPHIVRNVGRYGYQVFTLREGRLEPAPAAPVELWGFEGRR